MAENKNIWQMIKFTLFSISAGVIQISSFTLLNELLKISEDEAAKIYSFPYLVSLTLSVLWNFTLNRRYTFQSAANIPIAMLKVFGFYLVFTPDSTILGDLSVKNNVNEYIVLAVTMLSNFVLEYLFCKFVVYRNQEYTRKKS